MESAMLTVNGDRGLSVAKRTEHREAKLTFGLDTDREFAMVAKAVLTKRSKPKPKPKRKKRR